MAIKGYFFTGKEEYSRQDEDFDCNTCRRLSELAGIGLVSLPQTCPECGSVIVAAQHEDPQKQND